jgi:hypothetical protein
MINSITFNELVEYFWSNPVTIYCRLWDKGIPVYTVGRYRSIEK